MMELVEGEGWVVCAYQDSFVLFDDDDDDDDNVMVMRLMPM